MGSGSIPQAGYVASKGAVVNMTRELAAQWARRGVRVNAIAPGFFLSEMTEEMFSDERSMSWLRKKTPAGRPGEVEELYGAADLPRLGCLDLRHRPDDRGRRRLDRDLALLSGLFESGASF